MTTNIIGTLLSYLSLLLLLPLGFIVGALTERLGSRKGFVVSNKIWNTAVKLAVASLLWTRLVCIDLSRDDLNTCILPSSLPFLYQNASENIDKYGTKYDLCSTDEGIQMVFILIFKSLLLYVSTRFGASIQPVGLTGGIACGKSSVSKLLKESSRSGKKDAFAIVDVDAIAHDILVPGKLKEDCAYHRVVSTFHGEDIFEKIDKSSSKTIDPPPINRRKLGDIIFRDPIKRRKLNGITHPLISKVMMKQIIRENFNPSSNNTSAVAVDIPLLFEVGLKMKILFAIKVVIACTSELQLERLIKRNPDLTVEQCNKRIESQIPVYKKVEMADIVIWNNGTYDDLMNEVELARKEILSRTRGLMGITLPWLISCSGFVTTLVCLYDITHSL